MTAGVQNFEPAAYLPPLPSAPPSDAKGAAAADGQTADSKVEPSDFQSELQLQDGGTNQNSGSTKEIKGGKQIKSADRSEMGSQPKKKRDTLAQDPDLRAATPVQVVEPQKKILPVALTLAQPEEIVKPEERIEPQENVKPAEKAKPEKNVKLQEQPATPSGYIKVPALLRKQRASAAKSAPGPQSVVLPQSAEPQPSEPSPQPTPLPQLAEPQKSAQLQNSVALQQSPEELPKQRLAVSADPSVTVEPSNVPIPVVPLAQDVPVQNEALKAFGQPAESAKSTQPVMSTESQPVSPSDVRMPAPPPEPVATAVQETVDSASSSPSALAFAARMTVAPQKAEPSVSVNSSQPPAVAGSATLARIPVRYAATAQILSSFDVPSKDEIAAIERPVRIDARTDMVLARIETATEAAPGPGPAAPQQAEPTARTERVIEPPAAPPTSPRDIRVRVPDNNGGSTQVRFIESAGEVRVSVRTSDADLAQNLRGHLNDLTQRLAEGGIPAEIWKPASSETSSQNNQHQPDRDGRGSGGQHSGGQGGQQDRQEKRPAWLEQMEASLHAEV